MEVIDTMIAVGLGVVSVSLIAAFGLQLMGEVQADVAECPTEVLGTTMTLNTSGPTLKCYNATANGATAVDPLGTAEYNATGAGITALAKIPAKLGIIVLAFIIVIVISIIKLIQA